MCVSVCVCLLQQVHQVAITIIFHCTNNFTLADTLALLLPGKIAQQIYQYVIIIIIIQCQFNSAPVSVYSSKK